MNSNSADYNDDQLYVGVMGKTTGANAQNAYIDLKSGKTVLLNNLAFLLATCPDVLIRDPVAAVALAEKACQLTHYDMASLVGTLAAIYSEAGRFSDAIAMAEKSLAMASESGDAEFRQQSQSLLELYRAGRPFHEFTQGQPK